MEWNSYFERIEDAGFAGAKVALFLMMALLTISTLGRYFLGTTVPDIIPIIELYLMPGIIFLSAAKVQAIGGNVSTTVFARKLSTRQRRIALIIANVVTIIFLLVIVRQTTLAGWRRWINDASMAGALTLPTGYSWFLVSAGFGLLIIRMLYDLYKLWKSNQLVKERASDHYDDSETDGERYA